MSSCTSASRNSPAPYHPSDLAHEILPRYFFILNLMWNTQRPRVLIIDPPAVPVRPPEIGRCCSSSGIPFYAWVSFS